MCGRFSLYTDRDLLVEAFGLAEVDPAFAPRWNIAPTQAVAVVPNEEPRRLRMMRWGFVPAWSKDPKPKPLINARADTAAEKPSFRTAFREHRCLVLADGFYEWGVEGRERVPWHFRLRSGRPFAFAGLWEVWTPPGGVDPGLLRPLLAPYPADAMEAFPVSVAVNSASTDGPECLRPRQ